MRPRYERVIGEHRLKLDASIVETVFQAPTLTVSHFYNYKLSCD